MGATNEKAQLITYRMSIALALQTCHLLLQHGVHLLGGGGGGLGMHIEAHVPMCVGKPPLLVTEMWFPPGYGAELF